MPRAGKQSGTPSDRRGTSRRIRAHRLRDSIENGLNAIEVTTWRQALQLGQALLAQQDNGIVSGPRPDRPMARGDAGVWAPGRLAECDGGVTLFHRRRPQHQDIDALIGNAVATQGPRDARGGVLGISRLEPRPDAFLELGNDLIGDALLDIRFHCLFLLADGFA